MVVDQIYVTRANTLTMILNNEPEGDLVAEWDIPPIKLEVRRRLDGPFYIAQRHAGHRPRARHPDLVTLRAEATRLAAKFTPPSAPLSQSTVG